MRGGPGRPRLDTQKLERGGVTSGPIRWKCMGRADAGPGEAWLRAAWQVTTDAIAISDPKGVVLAANPAYYVLYGYSAEEVLGRSFAVIFPEAERVSAEAQYRDVFNGPDQQGPFEAVVRRRDGSQRMVESRISFIRDGGRRVAMLSLLRDVTDAVTARNLAARTEQARRDFLSSLSHDIKSPLAVVKGHAQVLRRHLTRAESQPSKERLVAGLAQIEASALQLSGLVDELVEVSGLAGGTPPLNPTPVDLVALARDAVERHQRLADEHELLLETPVDAAPGYWDAGRLQRVLDNLINNAIKYSPGGGVVRIGVAPARHPPDGAASPGDRPGVAGPERAKELRATQDGPRDGVLLTVRDRGIGISSADLPHVFERFRRGHNVDRSVGGSGVGLSSVQQIVQQHGGAVAVASREGEGTCVSVWLPLQAPATEEGSGP